MKPGGMMKKWQDQQIVASNVVFKNVLGVWCEVGSHQSEILEWSWLREQGAGISQDQVSGVSAI